MVMGRLSFDHSKPAANMHTGQGVNFQSKAGSILSKIEIDKRLKTIGNKFNNEFLAQCKNKKNYIGISLISEKEIKRQLGGTNTNIMFPIITKI